MSYLTCTNCGQKSPAEATRCKHCGQAFGRAPQQSGEPRRSSMPVVLLGGAALILLVAYQVWPRLSVAPSAAPPDTATVAASPPPPVPDEERAAAPAESVRTVPPPRPTQPPVESHAPAADTAPLVARTATPNAVPIDVASQRYAQTWANLRAERNSSASVVRVLHPGEVVAVDSLQEGWYRVVTDSLAVGYVDQQYLDTLPPSPPDH